MCPHNTNEPNICEAVLDDTRKMSSSLKELAEKASMDIGEPSQTIQTLNEETTTNDASLPNICNNNHK